jgi:hypothetical protein
MKLNSLKENDETDLENSANVIPSFPKTLPTYPMGTFGRQNSTRIGFFFDLQAVRQKRAERLFRMPKIADPLRQFDDA